jgi:hypothetical protein
VVRVRNPLYVVFTVTGSGQGLRFLLRYYYIIRDPFSFHGIIPEEGAGEVVFYFCTIALLLFCTNCTAVL